MLTLERLRHIRSYWSISQEAPEPFKTAHRHIEELAAEIERLGGAPPAPESTSSPTIPDPPVLKLGPGGDYTRELFSKDLGVSQSV